MFKTFYLSVAILFGISFLVLACSDDDDNDHKVPSAVESAFWKKYPDAKEVDWERKGEYEKADFKNDGNSAEAWFQNTGVWIFTDTDLKKADVPLHVIASFEGGMYASWTVDGYSRIERNKLPTLYCVEAESGEEDVKQYYKDNGVLARTVLDIESPGSLPASVSNQIKKQYPKAVILDVNQTAEKGYEIDLLDQGILKVMLFMNDEWNETRWQVSEGSLPAAVLETLQAPAYEGYTIDTVYWVVYPDGTGFYSISLMKEGSLDMVVRIRENGELMLDRSDGHPVMF